MSFTFSLADVAASGISIGGWEFLMGLAGCVCGFVFIEAVLNAFLN